ncbi:MAG: response regulator [Thaumarchaeota archaeon]|nr:response regulator [Nitrososphaerota archaeon]
MKILIAEDVKHTAEQYKIMLEENNHQVTLAHTGTECIKKYQDKSKDKTQKPIFDVVVLDYRLPEKDGLQVAKEIFKINPAQRIIFASAYVKEALIDATKELDTDVEILEKPFELEDFVKQVETGSS